MEELEKIKKARVEELKKTKNKGGGKWIL